MVDPKVQGLEFLETSTRAIVHFESSRVAVHKIREEHGEDRSQLISRGYEACLYWDTARVFELSGTSKTTAVLEEVFDNGTSIKEEEQHEVISRADEGVVSWETAEVFTVPKPTKEKAHRVCNLDHCKSAGELTQRTNNELQNRPQLLSMARMGTFQGVFEHKATAIRKELEAEKAALVVSSEESTTVLNEFETVHLKEMSKYYAELVILL